MIARKAIARRKGRQRPTDGEWLTDVCSDYLQVQREREAFDVNYLDLQRVVREHLEVFR